MIPFALGFFRKGTRFPKACTGIGNHVSPWHFIGKRRSKRREVKIWLTILHSLDSLVQWDQWVWNGDMAKAKIEMASNTDRDRDVEKSFYRNSETSTSSSKSMPEAESEPTRHRHVMFIFVLWLIFCRNSFFAVSSNNVHSLNMSLQSDLCILHLLSSDS